MCNGYSTMTSPILVTGGTGTLRQHVAALLRQGGGDVRVLCHRRREAKAGVELVTGDLATGEGIAAAVEGCDIIVHCAGTGRGDAEMARQLVQAGKARAPHIVYI